MKEYQDFQDALEKEWAYTTTKQPEDIIDLSLHRPTQETVISHVQSRHEELEELNLGIGVLFGSKFAIQLVCNLFMGPLTNRVGYFAVMSTGFLVMFASTILFAFGESYNIFFLARAVQGIGSSCFRVAGFGLLAKRYPNDKDRGNVMAVALGGIALGVLVGPPFGNTYQLVGKQSLFIVLAFLFAGTGSLHLLVLHPHSVRPEPIAPPLSKLLMDYHIIVAAGAIMIANLGIGMLEPTLPIWMMDTMNAPKWERGAAFLTISAFYLPATYLFGPLGHRVGRLGPNMLKIDRTESIVYFVSMASNGILTMQMVGEYDRSLGHGDMHVLHSLGDAEYDRFNDSIGVALGMPELGHLVDTRHSSVYGSVYAIADFGVSVGFTFGPAMSGKLMQIIGFEWMLVGIALITFAYSPLLFILRKRST